MCGYVYVLLARNTRLRASIKPADMFYKSAFNELFGLKASVGTVKDVLETQFVCFFKSTHLIRYSGYHSLLPKQNFDSRKGILKQNIRFQLNHFFQFSALGMGGYDFGMGWYYFGHWSGA